MHIVEMINDILQSIYVYMPQEILIILLAGLTLIVYESIKNGKKEFMMQVLTIWNTIMILLVQ